MLDILKNRKARMIMHETVAQDFEERCARISAKAKDLKYRVENGTGTAVLQMFKETIRQ
jgi:hypothetical protein